MTLAALATAASGVAGPLKTDRVPAPSAVVAHLDFDQLKKTEIGAFFLQQLDQPEVKRRLEAAILVMGFDPRTDVRSLTAFTEANEGEKPLAAVLLEGEFDNERLAVLAGGQPDYQKTEYGPDAVHQWVDRNKGRPSFGAMPAPGVLLVSDRLDAVHKALDVFHGRSPSLKAKPDGFPMHILNASNPTPVLVMAVAMDRLPNGERRAPALQGAQSGILTLSEFAGTASLDVALTFDSAEGAQRLRDIVQGLVAMTAVNAEQNPELAEVAQRVEVATEGGTARLKLRWPAEKVKESLQKAKERAQQRRAEPAPASVDPPPAELILPPPADGR
jgi:hypothetical protein